MPTTPPDPPAEGQPPHRAITRAVLPEVGWWTLRLLLWSAVVVAAGLIGGPLALFGLGGLVLVAGLITMLLAATLLRRAALPLALATGALVLTAAMITTQPARIDRSFGLLRVEPRTTQELETGSPYTRGHGSVFLDLRRTAFVEGQTTTVAASSDDGRIYVALPVGKCVHVELAASQPELPTSGVRGLALAMPRILGAIENGPSYYDSTNSFRAPDWQYGGFTPSNVNAYGRTVREPANSDVGRDGRPVWNYMRPVTDPRAPRLRLALSAPGMIFVRDYPRDIGPAYLSWDGGQPVSINGSEQVGDARWPENIALPPSPGDVGIADQWRERPTGSHVARQYRVWRKWAERWVVAARNSAALAAGTCATTFDKRSYWQTAYVNQPGSQVTHHLSVNGNGTVRVYRAGSDGVARIDRDPPPPFAHLAVVSSPSSKEVR
ncbi:MAG: hypothetical protein J7513_06970 [Solirubrobacteraceae bacterium]|nr:hypothetical protein [Solirubrobacteraceae bacterium]